MDRRILFIAALILLMIPLSGFAQGFCKECKATCEDPERKKCESEQSTGYHNCTNIGNCSGGGCVTWSECGGSQAVVTAKKTEFRLVKVEYRTPRRSATILVAASPSLRPLTITEMQ